MERINLIRIGSLLHNIEDSSSFNLILKKLVDYTFAFKNTTILSVYEIIEFLSSEDGICMDFGHDEIVECIKEFDSIFNMYGNKDVESIEIDDTYLTKIIEKIKTVDLESVLQQFYDKILPKNKKKLYKKDKITEAIYLFLYTLLIESEIEYKRLFSIDIKGIAKLVRKIEYTDIVNDFINWDDEAKNNILYSLYGAGLEFSILSMKKNLIDVEALKGKTIYLDTNVVFRILGINGPDLQKRTEDFVSRFSKTGMKIKISSVTKNEFDDTIKQKILFLRENLNHSSKYTIEEFQSGDRDQYSFFQFYIDWNKNKNGLKITSLGPYIQALFKKMIRKYKIDLETKIDKTINTKPIIDQLVDEYKEVSSRNRKTLNVIKNDMKNYNYILSLRENKLDKSFLSVNYFFLSTDYELISFDNSNKDNFKVVLHPARLYSIILKFCGRISATELMSFIRMLKVDIKTEERISEATRLIINDHLNFYESDVELQQPYLEALAENHILDRIEKADIPGKREILNEIFEKVSKEQLRTKQIENDNQVNIIFELKKQLDKKNKNEYYIKLIISIVCIIVIALVLFFGFTSELIDEKWASVISGISLIICISPYFIYKKTKK